MMHGDEYDEIRGADVVVRSESCRKLEQHAKNRSLAKRDPES